MPINTDLSVSPYFDDYDNEKDYYKILFKPGVAVQVRELNQLQTILQKQIERFGDNIYKRGTIIDGCNFIFHNPLPFVKINDVETDGTPVNVSVFKGYLAKNSANLVCQIVETSTGFESTFPDLNTLHVKYLNYGSSGSATNFTPGETITIYSPSVSVADVDIMAASQGFSNTDIPVFLSAITVQNSTGGQSFVNSAGQACTFSVGEVITQSVTQAKAEIREVNTSANSTHLILKIRPLATELRIGNTDSWTFIEGYSFTSNTSKITANLHTLIGSGAEGSIITNPTGGITTLIVTKGGSGYYVEPYVTAKYSTANNLAAAEYFNNLNIKAKNYIALVKVNELDASVGDGYGLSVSEGIIYQKGYFSRVENSFIVVEKYSTSTNNVVGFDTREEIVDFRTDMSLYDNATGTFNEKAPGANRLKLTPYLKSVTREEAAADQNFLSIIEFSEGRPFKQNKTTQFNTIGKQIARRTAEESGDYVLDQFLLSTSGQDDFTKEANTFKMSIDPGLAYINGYRVETNDVYKKDIRKGTNTSIGNTSIYINYGNYIKVKELGGLFKFSVGAIVSLRDTTATYITTSSGSSQFAAISAPGLEIGTARIRSLLLNDGSAGDPTAQYKLYLFDIRMNSGKNFEDVRSVYYDGAGTNDGIADLILENGKAFVNDSKNSSLIYYAGARSLKNANNFSYTYRTINDSVTCSTSGQLSISVAANPGEYLPYNTTLSDEQKRSIIVVPLANAICVNAGGSVVTSSGCTTITGTTTTFHTAFKPGDYIRIANSSAAEIKKIASIANATSITTSTTIANSYGPVANVSLVFPRFIPIPLFDRSNRTATVSANTTLNISLGNTISSATTMAVYFNAQRTVNAVPKSITRKAYVKIDTATNSATNVGPWCLGIPDIIRLRSVYQGNSTAVTTNDTLVTSNFWIDHNQKKDYYDVGFLYKNPEYNLSSSVYIMAEFDVLTTTQEGIKTISSYPVDDTVPLANSATTINTVEIPEMYHDNDEYYDLRDHFDFRPYSANTANVATSAADATLNPSEPSQANRFDVTYDKKFPVPQGECTATIENYVGRIDSIIMTSNGDFRVIEGISSAKPSYPDLPDEGLLINHMIIPPYPSLPKYNSANMSQFINRRISNIKFTTKRQTDYKVITPIDAPELEFSQPRRYTMKDIGSLERRIADLEYYASLGFKEDIVNRLKLPSSVDSTTDRFKFGFFVDDFTTTNYSEVNDPTYRSTTSGFELMPGRKQIQLKYKVNYKDAETLSCLNGKKIILPSTKKRLYGQSIATEATSIEVATTQTTYNTTGTEVQSSTTVLREITTKDYELLTKENLVANTRTVAISAGSLGSIDGTQSWNKVFEVGKLAGTIEARGGNQKDKGNLPVLERKIGTTWTQVATAIRGIPGRSDLPTNRTWSIKYAYTPNAAKSDRQFRVIQYAYSEDSALFGGSYPRTEDQTTYTRYNTYTVDLETRVETKTEVIPQTTIVENTTTITRSLFNSRNTALMITETLFNTASRLNTPFIDLTASIQQDINS